MAATTKTTKAAPAKVAKDTTKCRWGQGRYSSPATAKACTEARDPKRQLCAKHEQAYRAAAKARRTAAAPRPAPKLAVVKPAKSTPPTPARVAHPRVPAQQQIAAMVVPTKE
ncbi:MAG TPA: hypothetical protein VID26_09600 [Candidatus Limnocylindrales bacterium]|jgi:hypothetical protein